MFFYSTVGPHFDYPNSAVTVLLGYFVTGVYSIRVVQQSSVYKSMGFIYPNKFTYLNTIYTYTPYQYAAGNVLVMVNQR